MDFINFYTIIIALLYLYYYYYYMLREKCNLIHDSLGICDNSNVYLDESSCFAISRICGVHHVCTHVRNVTTWYLEKHLIMRRDNCQRKPRIMER